MMASTRTANQGQRLSKQDWLKCALLNIGEVGVAGLNIEHLAKHLKVTKGSFYWHFKDKDALIRDSINYWQETSTSLIGAIGERLYPDPADRLRYFLNKAMGETPDVPGGPIEMALREWARVSPLASERTRRVDQERISLMTNAYSELGLSEINARRFAVMTLSNIIGLNITYKSGSIDGEFDRNRYVELIISMAVTQGLLEAHG